MHFFSERNESMPFTIIKKRGLKGAYQEGSSQRMFSVVKRNGELADFNIAKINDAIMKAFNACEKQYTNDMIDLLSLRVTADFQSKMNENRIQVEDIQDSVEVVLEQAGYTEVAKAYILYSARRCVT